MNSFHLSLLLSISLLFEASLSVDFVFNGFNSSDILLLGNATIGSGILTLTNNSEYSLGRALYRSKIPAKAPNSSDVYPFSTSFIFAMSPYRNVLPGHGLVFLFAPSSGIDVDISTMAQNLGFINKTLMGKSSNHVLGIEFDVFKNEEFNDIDDNHVGIDVNSLTSLSSHTAGYWPGTVTDEKSFEELELNSGRNYQVWIDYLDSVLTVTMALVGMTRPRTPLLNVTLDLAQVFEDDMYVGFTAATGQLVQGHKILGWSFSNRDSALSDKLITTGLPSFVLSYDAVVKSKGFIIGVSIGCFLIVSFGILLYLIVIRKKHRKEALDVEEWELEYWPHRIVYRDIESATKGFLDENVIGVGGNGKVYKGVLPGGTDIAVKRISHDNNEGLRAFLAEIACLGRLKHRNLVGLRGWCKKETGILMLVYDYMENGSLDKRIFQCDKSQMLCCEDRIRVLKDVACGLLYLHDGWEARVLHRDIKASNVLLDNEMNGRLGDFGLARMHEHGTVAGTTRVMGTMGYLAPEVIRTGRASAPTDVFGFGILVLEVMCGRRPIEPGQPSLISWVSELAVRGELLSALDVRILAGGMFDEDEVFRVLHLGVVCAHPDANLRPTMRQVVNVLELKESDSEKMDAYLLQITDSIGQGQNNLANAASSHPTFEDLRRSTSSSMTFSWSNNSVVEGR